MPTAEVDSSGRVYVAWSDCVFESGCNANDIVMTSSTDGVSWTPVVRIPTDPLNSGVDHFIPGLAVDPNTGGSTAHLALTYYYFPAGSSDTERRVHVVARRRRELDARVEDRRPDEVPWIANTNQGYMVGDYISTSFTGDGKAHPVFSLAKAPDSGANGSCYPNNTGCHQRLTSATFDITLPPPCTGEDAEGADRARAAQASRGRAAHTADRELAAAEARAPASGWSSARNDGSTVCGSGYSR